jgi:hypothetical protein
VLLHVDLELFFEVEGTVFDRAKSVLDLELFIEVKGTIFGGASDKIKVACCATFNGESNILCIEREEEDNE